MAEEHIPSRSALSAVLSYRLFRYLWFGQIASQLALNMLIFVLALVVYQATGSNAAVSGLFLAYGIPAVFFGMVAGAVVDRLDKRFILMSCDITRAILVGILFFATRHIGVIYLFVFLNALINQLYVPAEAPTIPRLVPEKNLVSANSLFSFTYYSSMALGFILAGPVLRILGSQSLLFVSGLFLLASLFVSRLPKEGDGMEKLTRILRYKAFYIFQRMLTDLQEGLRYVASQPTLSDALLLLTGTQVILAMLGTLGPGFADRVLGIDVRDASLVIVGPTVVGIVLGALWVGSRGFRIPAARLIGTGIVSAGVLLMSIAASVSLARWGWFGLPRWFVLPLTFLLFFLLGVANSLLDVPANSLLQKEAAGDMRGRVYGMLAAVVGGLGMLPVVVGGVLADVVGVGNVIFLLGALVLVYGVWRVRYNT